MLNEHLRPLERYLMKQIGRPWDKVYAEIRRGIDTRSAIGLHVLQHVPDYVFINTRIDANGKVVGTSRYGVDEPVWGMYVHPRTGLLRYAKSRRARRNWRERRPDEAEDNFVPIDADSAYQKLNGLWYRTTYGEAPAPDQPRPLVAKFQLDRKTVKRLEAGSLGVATNKFYWVRITL